METKASVLIVDDDEGTRKSLSLILKKKGYQAEMTGTGGEALEKANDRFFNVALLDIKLPDMKGVELLAPLKKMHPDMVLIMVTAYASLETAMHALNHGASFYLTKPLNMDEVLSTLREVIEKQRLVIENRLLLEKIQKELTERKQLEEQVRHVQKMEAIGRLAGGVAHDFNNILTVILGNCHLMLADLDKNDPLYIPCEQIELSCKRAEALTRQLLAISRKQVLQPKVLNINTVIHNMEKMLKRIVREDIQLVTLLDLETASIKADPGQIEQVFLNLVVNARDAMPNGGKLVIETKNIDLKEPLAWRDMKITAGSYIMISVSDTGVGMDKEALSHIFDPFFTTKKEGEGTGLGLSTVYGIVQQSGGYVNVYSEPGKGTIFKIYFPVTREAAERVESVDYSKLSLTGDETILVVEDGDFIRDLACQTLRMRGYHVLEAPHGGNALLKCEQYKQPIHLILTDVVMPEMNGPQLVQRLKTLHPEMKVLYMSGYADDAVIQHGLFEKEAQFIQKPFTPSDLVKKIRDILDGNGPRQSSDTKKNTNKEEGGRGGI